MTWFSLKVQKPCFYAIFDHFCPMGIFSKKSSSVTRYYMWASNTMLSFRKKLMSQCWEKLRTDGRTDGWMEVKIYRTPQAEAGGPIKRPESRFKVKRTPIPFLFQNDQVALNKIYFRKTINIIPMSLLAPFNVQNCKTILTSDPEL